MKSESEKIYFSKFGTILYILHKNNRKYLNDSFAEYNLNLLQVMCLFMINFNDNVTQKKLAELLYLTKAGITKSVNNLELEGYIIREKSPQDNRQYIIELSKKGEKIVPILMDIYDSWEDKIGLNELDESFFENLNKITRKAIELNSE